MTAGRPRVSVVIPTHDRRIFLRKAIASVQSQTFEEWELIVVDDGSTDGTLEYVEEVAQDDSRIRLLAHQKCGNVARLRNLGVRESQGYYVGFLDSDDIWHPGKLEAQLSGFDHEGRYRWSYTGFRLIDEEGEPTSLRAGSPWQPRSGDLFLELLSTEAAAPIQTLLVERSLLSEVGLLDESLPYKEDYELLLRLARRSEAYAVDARMVSIREHAGRSTKAREDVHEWSLHIYDKFCSRRTTCPEQKRICDERRAYHLVALARSKISAGSHGAALLLLLRAFRYDPTSRFWWRSLGQWGLFPFAKRLRF